jgi:phosphoribosylaminoimidazolecarboxamide formyltransferase/IMP cyclohydrolase
LAFNRVETITDLVPLRRALVSVYDKSGLAELVRGLADICPGVELYSTGGSHAAIADIIGSGSADLRLVSISEYTGREEMAGGLVKTLDWKIYLGLLAEEGNPSHVADLERYGARPFDLVVGDLYPFEAASLSASSTVEELRQRIDIGGPAMIRAAAKNFLRVVSVSSPRQYGELLAELRAFRGCSSLGFRLRLASEAFKRVSAFDSAIADRLSAVSATEIAACYSIT